MHDPSELQIRKASQVKGKSLIFRDATVADAELILRLRNDAQKGQFLSSTSNSVDAQRDWLNVYSGSSGQAYFIIEHSGEAVGTVRLYDAKVNSFCWGSWIIADGLPSYVAVESALIVYAYALDHLCFLNAHFDVRAANEKVWRFHERFGAKKVSESGINFFFEIRKAEINASRKRYCRFLPDSVEVIW